MEWKRAVAARTDCQPPAAATGMLDMSVAARARVTTSCRRFITHLSASPALVPLRREATVGAAHAVGSGGIPMHSALAQRGGELRPRSDLELLVGVAQGRLDRLLADADPLGDLPVAHALRGERGDALLTRRQRVPLRAAARQSRQLVSRHACPARCTDPLEDLQRRGEAGGRGLPAPEPALQARRGEQRPPVLQRNRSLAVERQRAIDVLGGVLEPALCEGDSCLASGRDRGPGRSRAEVTASSQAVGECARTIDGAKTDERLEMIGVEPMRSLVDVARRIEGGGRPGDDASTRCRLPLPNAVAASAVAA